MRKNNLISAIFAMVIIGSTIFYACKKEENVITKQEVTEKRQKAKGDGWRVFAADCKGVLSGAATGATIGTAVGGATGAATGAIIGGVVGGTAASIEKAMELKAKEPSKIVNVETINTIEMVNEASNPNNPFDAIGAAHYKIINYCVENNFFVDNDVFDRIAYYDMVTAPDMVTNYFPQFTESNLTPIGSEYVQYYDHNAMETTLSNIDLPFSTYLHPTLSFMIEEYDEYMENSTSFSDFYQYSIQKEDEIIANTYFVDIEKQIVLSYMATARYGYWYWNTVIGFN
ncbi:MAG: hypothetical protein LBE13_17210 [Bacteroidales bacterium]|jgi:uncharacterized membrane protein|nr:hypothetical protein [Bacteroidales bacterium]